jgi:alkaline phosphatase D
MGAALAMLIAGGSSRAGADDLLVTVGEVSANRAVVWVRPSGPGPVEVLLRSPRGAEKRLQARAPEATDFAVKLPAVDLAASTRYAYRVTWRGERAEGEFVTAPEPRAPTPVRLVWSGDLGGSGRCRAPGSGYAIFGAMAARRPDLFLFVGDTIYADHRCPTPENVPGANFLANDLAGYRAKHRYNRADPAVQAFFRSAAVFAIWDDHEVRNDFSGPDEPMMSVGRRAFLEYWPIEPPAGDPSRLYRRVRWGRLAEIFILDTRQYRSPNVQPDGPQKTMLGAAQRDWLLAGITRSDAVWKLVVSSVTLSVPTGRVARDGWANGSTHLTPNGTPTGFEHELSIIVNALAEGRVTNVVWLATDVHRAEVLRHGPRPGLTFYELIAGPLSGSTGRPGVLDDTLRPTRLFGDGGYFNFGELAIRPEDLAVRIIDATGRVRFETTLRPDAASR